MMKPEDSVTTALFEQIVKKGSDKEAIAINIIENPNKLTMIYEGLSSKNASVKYGCENWL